MFRLTLQTIRARKARFVLTAVAVVLGVAFMAGTLVLTDTIRTAYDGIADTTFASTDVVVQSRNHIDAGQDVGTQRGTVPATVVGVVRRTHGVVAADGVVEGIARLVGRDGALVDDRRGQATPIGMAWPSSGALNPLRLVAGQPPAADDAIVIDRASARDGHFGPGDRVRVVTPSGSAEYTVAGVATYGSDDDAGGAGVVAFTPATAARVLGGAPGRVDSIRAVGAEGISEARLVQRVRAALPAGSGLEVLTRSAAVDQARDQSRQGMAFMSTFLLVFAVVALVVGGFVIFNAFSITVAQRTRETAMLRAIGSSRRQVLRMIVTEALMLGVVASAVGAVVGIALAQGLAALLTAFGVELPGGSTVISTGALATPIVVGVVVTVLAAYLPARRAARVSPMAALRDVSVDTSGSSWRRALVGTFVVLAGAALVVIGASGSGAAGPVGLGAFLVFVGAVVLGPVVGAGFVRVVGAPLSVRGVTGTLARDNAARNPKRTAATASALMIGVALVVLISVFAASARASIDANIDSHLKSDWVITGLQQDGLSPAVAATVDRLPETASVTSFRVAPATVAGATAQVTGIDPANVEQHLDVDVKAGSVHHLGPTQLGVLQKTADEHHWHVGDRVTVDFAETGPQHLTVALIYGLQNPLGDYTVSQQTFAANVAHQADQAVFVVNAPGVSEPAARAAISGALATFPTAKLHTPAEFEADIAGQIDQLLNLIYVLLVLAVVISLFGIANTLALSVVERKRELGLLRAVGMQRSQVRAGVRWEAVLIALFGTALGVGLGLAFGWALVSALHGEGIDRLAVPEVRLVAVAGVAALAAVLAAALPARRAARLDVLEAISS